jgi:uncharacterized HAD superfamily protein
MTDNEQTRAAVAQRKIVLDLDGTLADVSSAILGQVSLDSRRPVTLADVNRWNWLEPLGLGEEYFRKTYAELWERYPTEAFQPYERRVDEYVAELCNDNIVDIATGHDESSRPAVAKWLELHKIPYDNLVMLGSWQSRQSKSDILCNIVIDDDPSLAAKIATNPKERRMFLFDQLYNRDVPECSVVIRVRSLHDVVLRLHQNAILDG